MYVCVCVYLNKLLFGTEKACPLCKCYKVANMQNCPLLKTDYKLTEEYPVSKFFLLAPLYCHYLGYDWSKLFGTTFSNEQHIKSSVHHCKGRLVTR